MAWTNMWAWSYTVAALHGSEITPVETAIVVVATNGRKHGATVIAIAVNIVAGRVMTAGMATDVDLEADGQTHVEMSVVGIRHVRTKGPTAVVNTERSIETLCSHKAVVLIWVEHVREIFVTIVEVGIIAVDGVRVATLHIVEVIADGVDEVIVDFVAVVILHGREVEFVCHAVAQEARILPHLAPAKSHHIEACQHHNQS